MPSLQKNVYGTLALASVQIDGAVGPGGTEFLNQRGFKGITRTATGDVTLQLDQPAGTDVPSCQENNIVKVGLNNNTFGNVDVEWLDVDLIRVFTVIATPTITVPDPVAASIAAADLDFWIRISQMSPT